MIGMI